MTFDDPRPHQGQGILQTHLVQLVLIEKQTRTCYPALVFRIFGDKTQKKLYSEDFQTDDKDFAQREAESSRRTQSKCHIVMADVSYCYLVL